VAINHRITSNLGWHPAATTTDMPEACMRSELQQKLVIGVVGAIVGSIATTFIN
jgi:hypothetical protein